MGVNKKLFEELYEYQWHREKIYLDYERDLEYDQLKREFNTPFFVGKSVKVGNYKAKMTNFVKRSYYVRGNWNRINRNTEKRQFQFDPFVVTGKLQQGNTDRYTRSKSTGKKTIHT